MGDMQEMALGCHASLTTKEKCPSRLDVHLEEALLALSQALAIALVALLLALQLLLSALQLLRVPAALLADLPQLRLQLRCLPPVTLCGFRQTLLCFPQLCLRTTEHTTHADRAYNIQAVWIDIFVLATDVRVQRGVHGRSQILIPRSSPHIYLQAGYAGGVSCQGLLTLLEQRLLSYKAGFVLLHRVRWGSPLQYTLRPDSGC